MHERNDQSFSFDVTDFDEILTVCSPQSVMKTSKILASKQFSCVIFKSHQRLPSVKNEGDVISTHILSI